MLLCEDLLGNTIVALATPPGKGAIAVVRLSGRSSHLIACESLGIEVSSVTVRQARVGRFRSADGRLVDEVVATFFKSPGSYTGEDLVEVSCHGSPLIARMIVEACVARGARIATPGEFTRRALANGKIDLLQAEAVRDLIESRTRFQLELAIEQREGRLSAELRSFRDEVIEVICQLETALEFGEEDVVPAGRWELAGRLERVTRRVERWMASYEAGRCVRSGLKVVLTGLPNAGKSSLFNALVKSERAIVTPVPGTTRDSLREWLDFRGLAVCLVDTAGLVEEKGTVGAGEGAGVLEVKGAERTRAELAEADLVLLVVDRARGFECGDEALWRECTGKKVAIVFSKTDLGGIGSLPEQVEGGSIGVLETSAVLGTGLEAVEQLVVRAGGFEDGGGRGEAMLTELRQKEGLERSLVSLQRARTALEAGLSEEFVSQDLRDALRAAGELTGETENEEILDRVFSTFCIGK